MQFDLLINLILFILWVACFFRERLSFDMRVLIKITFDHNIFLLFKCYDRSNGRSTLWEPITLDKLFKGKYRTWAKISRRGKVHYLFFRSFYQAQKPFVLGMNVNSRLPFLVTWRFSWNILVSQSFYLATAEEAHILISKKGSKMLSFNLNQMSKKHL